ncbi:hypothetical protein Tco_0004853 [Tanacetum coccineum]
MTTLAEFMILSGGDNRPPMLEKPLYDSWKTRMELYMQNREHGRMILESVEHGPLIWPTIEEPGQRNMLICLVQRKFKLIVISRKPISFFKDYHLKSCHHGPSDAMHNPSQLLKSDTKVFTMKMEILLEPTSNKLYGNPDGRSYWIKTSQDLKPHAHT